jgi:hypothetical protein
MFIISVTGSLQPGIIRQDQASQGAPDRRMGAEGEPVSSRCSEDHPFVSVLSLSVVVMGSRPPI